ncbi:MAG TPA: DUF1549 and DUF1553 domain-containing protein [Gemmataceae bacterium]|nr:DUF1549 and DUF1553 domain-containing protein [Gemmataceae bacterium]
MSARLTLAAGLVALLLPVGSAVGQGPSPPAKRAAAAIPDVQTLAVLIDQHLAKRWADVKVTPAPLADDAEFLRRVYLDLAGRIPSVAEARSFLTDKNADRRTRLVERLLASPRYVTHFANVYRALLIPEASNNFLVRLQQGSFEDWLKQQVGRNVGYDRLVHELLTAPLPQGFNAFSFGGNAAPSTLAFYSAKEFRPENLAAGTARAFLGISIECAQCHPHPFADWKREQFWGFAAFFSGIQSQRFMDFLLPGAELQFKRELTMPNSEKVIQARFFDGAQPAWKEGKATRAALADWVTSASNPYFARTTVNRTWAYFFGTGLIEPVDEMVGTDVKASHPELLDLLAREFAEHQFDMKFLIRAITATRAYQLTSAGRDKAQEDATLFARMPLRGLTAEQLFDSVAMATGYRDAGNAGDDLLSAIAGGKRSARSEFLNKFGNQTERPVKAQTSILQALSLMNGRVVADATSLERSETLGALLDAPFLSTAERIEALYLAALARRPSERERERALRFVDEAVRDASGSNSAAYNNAVADVFWALLNSSEFVLNH